MRNSLNYYVLIIFFCLTEFPSLQKVLMDSELPTLVVKMSTCDSESFVRATAIKCLQEMIQVEEIWNNALKSEDLPVSCLYLHGLTESKCNSHSIKIIIKIAAQNA